MLAGELDEGGGDEAEAAWDQVPSGERRGAEVLRKEAHRVPSRRRERSGKNECNVEFHVTNTTKPLASALAVVNAGNRVVLTKEPGGSFIENIATKKKIKLKEVGGTFVFDVESERRSDYSGFKRRA